MSRPASAEGMAWPWIAVGTVKPILSQASQSDGCKPYKQKILIHTIISFLLVSQMYSNLLHSLLQLLPWSFLNYKGMVKSYPWLILKNNLLHHQQHQQQLIINDNLRQLLIQLNWSNLKTDVIAVLDQFDHCIAPKYALFAPIRHANYQSNFGAI